MMNERTVTGEQKFGWRTRRRWSSEQKSEFVERWCESGLSRAEFCRQEGLSYGSFVRWINEIDAEGNGPAEFVEVVPAAGASAGLPEPLEVVAPNGWRVRVAEGFDATVVERLLELVARC